MDYAREGGCCDERIFGQTLALGAVVAIILVRAVILQKLVSQLDE